MRALQSEPATSDLDQYELFRRVSSEQDALNPTLQELTDIWHIVSQVVRSEQEQAVLIDSFVYALPPRTILARHPDLFSSTDEIYQAKRQVFARLVSCHELPVSR